MANLYGLDENGVRTLRLLTQEYRGRRRLSETPQRRRRISSSEKGSSNDFRFAISILEIPAAEGDYENGVTPGFNEEDEEPINNILLFDWGSGFGEPVTNPVEAKAENYAPSAVAIHKGLFVYERESGVWVVKAEFCAAYPAPEEES